MNPDDSPTYTDPSPEQDADHFIRTFIGLGATEAAIIPASWIVINNRYIILDTLSGYATFPGHIAHIQNTKKMAKNFPSRRNIGFNFNL